MSDRLRDALLQQLTTLPQSTPEMAASWPIDFAKVDVTSFVPFGISDLTAKTLTTEWAFAYALKPAATLEVVAMFTGLLSWLPAQSTLRLESFHHPSSMLNLLDEDWPAWMPIARVLEYRSLDAATVGAAITGLVSRLTPKQREVIDANAPQLVGLSAFEVATEFMAAPTAPLASPLVLPIRKGEALGTGTPDGGGKRFAVRARERLGSTYFVNLAYQAKKLRELSFLPDPAVTVTGTGDAAVIRAALVDATGPVIGSGTVRTVAAAVAAGATHTNVRAAVMAAAAGDLIVVTDAAVHPTPTTIVIDKPLVLTSTATVDARTTGIGLPTLHGVKPAGPRTATTWASSARRVIAIGKPTFSDGVIQISNLVIDQGAASHGGGVWVDECHQVMIENVRFENNEAFGGGWLYEGFGGGIGTRHAGILVRRCGFFGNGANCRGGGIGVFGYGWPIITDCRFEGNQSKPLGVTNAVSGRPFLHRPDGGALGIQMATPNTEDLYGEVALFLARHEGETSQVVLGIAALQELSNDANLLLTAMAGGSLDPYWDADKLKTSRRNAVILKRCQFTSNTSQDDGGAIYLTGLVRMRMRDCTLTDNKADTNGGGLRISTACDAVVQACTFIGNESNAKNRGYACEVKDGNHSWQWVKVGGGAIAARTSNLKLVGVTVQGSKAKRYAGGGIFFTSTDDGRLPTRVSLGNDWNTIRDLLVRCGTGPCPEFRQFSLVLENTTIENNACGWTTTGASPTAPAGNSDCGPVPTDWNTRDQLHAKGGGIYALRNTDDRHVYPPIKVQIAAGCILKGNVAAFSATATELFIADLNAPAPNNPVADTSALTLDAAGALTTPYLFTAVP